MFSDKEARLIDDSSNDLWEFIDELHYDILEEFNLSAIVVIRCHTQYNFEILSTVNIERSPLETGEKKLIFDLLDECIKWHKKEHLHKINDQLLNKLIPITKGRKPISDKVIFLPYLLADTSYVAFSFQDNPSLNKIPDGLSERIAEMVLLSKKLSDTDTLINRLHTLEKYVKEVGHDFASSVQSATPKLSNIAQNRYHGKMLLDKAREAESEIWSAYRHASNLGLVVDPRYYIKGGDRFDIVCVVQDILKQYESEAKERHITISTSFDQSSMNCWGDEDAIATAISHYLLNALKYSFGSSTINILVLDIGADIDFKIRNKGLKLHRDEHINIWNCGFRGREAYERHVNGCGIGLYTVKKIIEGHGGFTSCRVIDNQHTEFSFRIPKDKNFNQKLF